MNTQLIVNAPFIEKVSTGHYRIYVWCDALNRFFTYDTTDSQLYDVWGDEELAKEMDIDISIKNWVIRTIEKDSEVMSAEFVEMDGYNNIIVNVQFA